MRWNCPHCGSNLAVSDDKVGNGWSFSRCYKCGGFALVRRSDVNLVKVDRAPPGEHVLLPEANENPAALLSKAATQNLARYTGTASASAAAGAAAGAETSIQVARAENKKPVIRTAVRRKPDVLAPEPQGAFAAGPSHGFALPEPLPEEPATGIRQRLVPFAIAITGMLAISSGIYLYVQGQALWEKAKMQTAETPAAAQPPVASDTEASAPLAEPNGTEVVEAPPISPPAAGSAAAGATRAPTATAALAPTLAAAAPVPARPDLIDEVHANAMAPDRNPPAANPQIKVELLTETAHIHSGPGMTYPVVGTASNQKKYAVEEWRDRWFKIRLENPGEKKTAWIRNDLVRLAP